MSRLRKTKSRANWSQEDDTHEQRTLQRRTRSETLSQTNRTSQHDEHPRTSRTRMWRKMTDDSMLSQPSQSSQNDISPQSQRSQNKWAKLSEYEEIHLANKVIRYMLAMDRKKQVIQKLHIIKQVLQENGKNYERVMGRVKERMSKVLGYQLVEIESKKYILVNELENTVPHLSFSEEERKQQVLLFIVLTHVFMCNNSCFENELWDFLQRLNILNENSEHEYFGDVKGLICGNFITQQYLVRTAVDKDEDSSRYIFRWGNRAMQELSARHVLEFMSTVYGGRRIESWPQQFKAMKQFEKETAELSDDNSDS